MRLISLISVAAITFAIFASAASADLLQEIDPYVLPNGDIDVAKLKAALAEKRAAADKKFVAKQREQSSSTKVYLREGFTDLGFFNDDRFDLSKSKGASISFTKDRASDDTILNFKGTLFVSTRMDGDYDSDYLGWTISPFIGANIDHHSARSRKDTENYNAGLAAEVGTDHWGFDQFYRLKVKGIRDVIGDTSLLNAEAEFFPVLRRSEDPLSCIGRPCTVPAVNLLYVITPSFYASYGNSFEDNGDPFSEEDDSLRMGARISLLLQPGFLQGNWLSRFYMRITYQWAEEIYSGKTFDNFNASAWYNLDEQGHLALTASYTLGEDEDTAEDVNKFVVGLTGKF